MKPSVRALGLLASLAKIVAYATALWVISPIAGVLYVLSYIMLVTYGALAALPPEPYQDGS